ncbi:MAG: hypothetical protein HGA49_01195 [Eubacteriaceae bacterium]|nr:hypothetical protein [Eubacteriaceae bacterium]
MISIIRKNKGIKIEEVWFCPRKENDKNVDIISYCQTPSKFGYLNKQGRTLINDLTLPEEELFNNIHKDDRYQIRRAQRAGIETAIYFGKNISEEMIQELQASHLLFTQEKNLPSSYNELEYLKLLRENDCLALSVASSQGKVIVYHSYLYDEFTTRGVISFSHFRSDESVNKRLVGMANRLLHYRDMLEFKNRGIKVYDWAGISDEADIKSINDFKRKFGGVEIDTFFVQEAVSLKGKLALEIKKRFRSIIRSSK